MTIIYFILFILLIVFAIQAISDKATSVEKHPYLLDKELNEDRDKRFKYHYEKGTEVIVNCPVCKHRFNSTIGNVECPSCHENIFVDIWD